MKFVRPKVFHLAGTSVDKTGLNQYLHAVGAPDWRSNATSDGELLIEVAGKSCYKSFHEDLNANLTRVRTDDNKGYLLNMANQKHGSVFEHVYDTYALVGVSRVLTHELVRHRIADYSQESLRFVRLTELSAYFPQAFGDEFLGAINTYLLEQGLDPLGISSSYLREFMQETFEYLEDRQLQLANDLRLDDLKSFHMKKKLTSGMRRLAPIGLATVVIMTSNARNWRHVIKNRTDAGAEEEIRLVMGDIFADLRSRYPSIYQDARVEIIDYLPQVTFKHEKI